jgi:NOL1/NOP2/sun family putative RNA methylase
MKETLKDEYDSFISSYSLPPLSGCRANTLKITPDELCSIFPHLHENVQWCPSGFYYDGGFGKDVCHRAGLFYSQEPSAMIAAELLDVQEGDVVLDLCAAPGGKSTQIAAKLNSEGLLVSNEIVRSRSLILRENIERMGIKNAVVTNMSPEKLECEFENFFDKILVDAPCSGEGMFRKDDEAVRAWSTEHTISCAARQRLILDSAAKMLAPGGAIVYSTCTFSEAENQDTIKAFLDNHSEFTLDEMHILYPHKIKGEGHFAARLVKSGAGEKMSRRPLLKEADDSSYRRFEKENLNVNLQGKVVSFGENLYLLPPLFGDLGNIKITLAGLHLGEVKKNRFEPSHHLCLALKKEDFKVSCELSREEADVFYQGGVFNKDVSDGWGAMLYKSYPLGWFKSSGGTLKNHYPKKLRG